MSGDMATRTVRILIADDHPVFLRGLCMLLELRAERIKIVGTATTGTEAVQIAQREPVDVALLDIRMPGLDGVAAARMIRAHNPSIRVVILTTFDERELVHGALDAGVSGYLLKDAPVDEIVDAIEMAFKGRLLLSTRAARRLREDVDDKHEISEAQHMLNQLAPREQEVFLLLAHGEDNATIAGTLSLSEGTVRNYVSRIYDVLQVRRRTEAMAWAQIQGLV